MRLTSMPTPEEIRLALEYLRAQGIPSSRELQKLLCWLEKISEPDELEQRGE